MLTTIKDNIHRNEGDHDFDKRHVTVLANQLTASIAGVTATIKVLCSVNMHQEDINRDMFADDLTSLPFPSIISVAASLNVASATVFSPWERTRSMAEAVS